LSRVNQLAERAQALSSGDVMAIVTGRLIAARKRLAAGLPVEEPSWWSMSDDDLRQRGGSAEVRRITERLIAARRRVFEHRQ
jgi:hypothetical protein